MELSHKRTREDSDSSVAKRLHVDLLREILTEEDSDAGEPDVNLATVIKILEEEIAVSPEVDSKSVEIGYLHEASDDELGIPPAAGDEGVESEAGDGFGRIWGYEDDGIPAWYEGLVFDIGFMAAAAVEGVAGGELFDGEVFVDSMDFGFRQATVAATGL